MIQSCIIVNINTVRDPYFKTEKKNSDHPEELGMFNHFQRISLPNYDITIWGIQHGSTLRDRQNLSRTHVTIKMHCLMCGLCGVHRGTIQTCMQTSHQRCHLSKNCRDLNKPKALHQCFDALQVRDHLVRHFKISKDQTLCNQHLPSGSSCYMLLHVVYIYTYHLQLYTSRLLQPFQLSKSNSSTPCPSGRGIRDTEVLHTMRSKWQPEPGRDYKFQAWDLHWKTPSVVKIAMPICFFSWNDFPCLKNFLVFFPCRIVQKQESDIYCINSHSNANGASNIGSIWFFYWIRL